MQKLTGWLGDNFGGLDGPIVGEKKHTSQNFHISSTCLWGLWEMEFFFVEREVLKAPPAAMDAFDEEKHHAVITLSLWTAFEY